MTRPWPTIGKKDMALRVLIDTNVFLDYFTKREPFFPAAQKIIRACEQGKIEGHIAAHSVLNMFFILRHDYTIEQRRAMLKDICLLFPVVSVDRQKLLSALTHNTFSDFEDCVQIYCALSCNAEYIITRDQTGFADSPIPGIFPDVFCQLFLNCDDNSKLPLS